MVDNDSMKSEYRRSDLGAGTRGKHLGSYQQSKNIVLLSPDVAAAFPTEEAVNAALRTLMPKASPDGRQT
jgi:hypothetical protein